jgi:hypothetical protein
VSGGRGNPLRAIRRHCEERQLRSNPAYLTEAVWIASLALAMTQAARRDYRSVACRRNLKET